MHFQPSGIRPESLPATVAEIAGVIGVEAAMAIAKACETRRRRLYVPRRMRPDHYLIGVIGAELAAVMVAEYGGMLLYVASCNQHHARIRNAEILEAFERKESRVSIAARYNLTPRMVAYIIRSEKSLPMTCRRAATMVPAS